MGETSDTTAEIPIPTDSKHSCIENIPMEMIDMPEHNSVLVPEEASGFVHPELSHRYHRGKSNSKIIQETTLVENVPWVKVSSPCDTAFSPTSVEHQDHAPESTSCTETQCHILELPIELLESLCREYIDITTATCLGLTCHTFFNITEHLYPFQVNLHMRTKGQNRKCLGHLLTDWMAPNYSFDHSWGKFLRTTGRYWKADEAMVEHKWRRKEGWTRINLISDNLGAVVAYESQTSGL